MMHSNFTRHIRITWFAALALTAFFLMQLSEPRWVAASDDSLSIKALIRDERGESFDVANNKRGYRH